jgi:hypothetical protein
MTRFTMLHILGSVYCLCSPLYSRPHPVQVGSFLPVTFFFSDKTTPKADKAILQTQMLMTYEVRTSITMKERAELSSNFHSLLKYRGQQLQPFTVLQLRCPSGSHADTYCWHQPDIIHLCCRAKDRKQRYHLTFCRPIHALL